MLTVVVPLKPGDFKAQCLTIKDSGANYVYIRNLGGSVVSMLKSCDTVGLNVTYLANIWAGDEPTIAAAEAKNYIFPSATPFWDQDAPGMKLVRQIADKSGFTKNDTPTHHYVRGVCSVYYIEKEAMEWARANVGITGENIQERHVRQTGLGAEGPRRRLHPVDVDPDRPSRHHDGLDQPRSLRERQGQGREGRRHRAEAAKTAGWANSLVHDPEKWNRFSDKIMHKPMGADPKIGNRFFGRDHTQASRWGEGSASISRDLKPATRGHDPFRSDWIMVWFPRLAAGTRLKMEAATTATEGRAAAGNAILEVKNVEVVFNDVILVLRGLSLEARRGGITALLGANGAGKSTTLKAIFGLLAVEDGAITRGSISFDSEEVTRLPPNRIVHRGIYQVMEGRGIVQDMTVIENLRLGAHPALDPRA